MKWVASLVPSNIMVGSIPLTLHDVVELSKEGVVGIVNICPLDHQYTKKGFSRAEAYRILFDDEEYPSHLKPSVMRIPFTTYIETAEAIKEQVMKTNDFV